MIDDSTKSRDDLERELLVTRCQLGEPEAFSLLVELWHEPLWRYVRSMTRDSSTAEEILQEVWLRILRGIDRLRDSSRLRSWLYSIARHTFIDRLRLDYADEAMEPFEDEPIDDEVDELAWETSEQLHAAIARLSLRDRETIELFYLQELDLREVSEVLEIPVGTVKSRLNRARRHLRDHLNRKGMTR